MEALLGNLMAAVQFIKDFFAHIMNFFNSLGAGSEDAE